MKKLNANINPEMNDAINEEFNPHNHIWLLVYAGRKPRSVIFLKRKRSKKKNKNVIAISSTLKPSVNILNHKAYKRQND